SAPSVMAFHASAWPHRRKEIITDFADRHFESMPERLRDLGYSTVYVDAHPLQPLFAFISTYSMHYPFRLPADAGEREVAESAGLSARYRQVLRYSDAQLGALLKMLADRPRRDRTVTI